MDNFIFNKREKKRGGCFIYTNLLQQIFQIKVSVKRSLSQVEVVINKVLNWKVWDFYNIYKSVWERERKEVFKNKIPQNIKASRKQKEIRSCGICIELIYINA